MLQQTGNENEGLSAYSKFREGQDNFQKKLRYVTNSSGEFQKWQEIQVSEVPLSWLPAPRATCQSCGSARPADHLCGQQRPEGGAGVEWPHSAGWILQEGHRQTNPEIRRIISFFCDFCSVLAYQNNSLDDALAAEVGARCLEENKILLFSATQFYKNCILLYIK